MKLALAVDKYVSRRRSDGSSFVSSELNLRAFCRWCGDIELSSLAAESVTEFLNSAQMQRCNTSQQIQLNQMLCGLLRPAGSDAGARFGQASETSVCTWTIYLYARSGKGFVACRGEKPESDDQAEQRNATDDDAYTLRDRL